MRRILLTAGFLILCASAVWSQNEVLSNADVMEMSKVGLERQIILKKIGETQNSFDVSVNALIELKKAGVDAEVIAAMLEKASRKKDLVISETQAGVADEKAKNYSENAPLGDQTTAVRTLPTPKEALFRAKSAAIVKSSLQPARQALEKELMKRPAWQKYNLSLVRYKQEADIFIEIGYVSLSWITHRYVFRIYDRRSGIVIAAGETTSWGSLSGNLAREITQQMEKVGTK